MKLKKAIKEDCHIISRIHAASWKMAYKGYIPQIYLDQLKEDFWAEAFQRWLSEGRFTAQLIFDGNMPVGCAAYGRGRKEELQDWGEIVSIYLLPDYFGKGYGKTLFQAALKDMREQGFVNIYLWVLEQNQRAISFYEKFGFVGTNEICHMEIAGEEIVDRQYILVNG